MKRKLQCLSLVLLGLALLALLYVLPVHYVDLPAQASDLYPGFGPASVQPSTVATYWVTNGAATLSISGTVYTVTSGYVQLDAAAYAYYQPLIQAGILVPYSGGAIVPTGGNLTVTGNISGNGYTYLNILTVQGTSALKGDVTAGAATFNGLVTVNNAITTSGPIILSGVAVTVEKFGMANSVVSGTTIAHGLGVTPTIAMVQFCCGSGITNTAYVLSTSATSITVGTVNAEGAAASVYWEAKK
jgi:hypothetical protein